MSWKGNLHVLLVDVFRVLHAQQWGQAVYPVASFEVANEFFATQVLFSNLPNSEIRGEMHAGQDAARESDDARANETECARIEGNGGKLTSINCIPVPEHLFGISLCSLKAGTWTRGCGCGGPAGSTRKARTEILQLELPPPMSMPLIDMELLEAEAAEAVAVDMVIPDIFMPDMVDVGMVDDDMSDIDMPDMEFMLMVAIEGSDSPPRRCLR